MKILKGMFLLHLSLYLSVAVGRDYSKIETLEDSLEKVQRAELKKRMKSLNNLTIAKKMLLEGNLAKSSFALRKIKQSDSALYLVAKRLEATIAFIKDDYQKVLDILKDPFFTRYGNYEQICLLKIMSQMAIKPASSELKRDVVDCSEKTAKYSKNGQFWLYNMALLKFGDVKKFHKEGLLNQAYYHEDIEGVRLWLTAALYTNSEHLISHLLPRIPPKAYESSAIRELLALIYYRLGNYERSLNLVEDLTTPNSENIKGNINLNQGKDVLAFGHYKLALRKKENSKNALIRALPLAWKLGQWQDGYKILKKILASDINENKKTALQIAFLVQDEKLEEAKAYLEYLKKKLYNKLPTEIDMMDTYISLRTKDQRNLFHSTFEICKLGDGMHCWLLGQLMTWENITKTANLNAKTPFPKDFDIESLKQKQEITGLDEEVIIDQKDIQEMDSKDIGLSNFIRRPVP